MHTVTDIPMLIDCVNLQVIAFPGAISRFTSQRLTTPFGIGPGSLLNVPQLPMLLKVAVAR